MTGTVREAAPSASVLTVPSVVVPSSVTVKVRFGYQPARWTVVVPGTVTMRDPAAVLRDAISRDADLRDRFTHAELVSTPAVIGPLAVDASHAGMAGLLLAGDAAGFIDPMTGDGLRFAFRGGELAAAVSLAALEGRIAAPHERLARARRREFGSKWRFNRSLRSIVDHDISVALAARAARIAPWLLRRTVAFAGDLPR